MWLVKTHQFRSSSRTMGCATSSVSPSKGAQNGNAPGSGKNIPSGSPKSGKGSPDKSSTSAKEGLIYTEAADNSGNLFAAIKRGDLEATKSLMKSMQEPTQATVPANGKGKVAEPKAIIVNQLLGMWNATPLIVATQYGQKEIALELLKLSDLGNLNHVNDKGASALLFACMEGLVDIVKILLAKQVTITSASTSEPIYNEASDQAVKCTPLSIAVANGHQAIVALLLNAGADLNTQFPFPTVKSILRHTFNESVNSIKGSPRSARISSQGAANLTPVMLAAASGKINVFRELLWRKCNCSIRDAEESTLLHHIARSKSEDSANMYTELKKNNVAVDALVEAKDLNGDTALIVACEGKQLELATMLLEDGCSASACSSDTGTSALHIAVKKRSLELVQVLLEYGADPLQPDKNKVSPYDAALKLHKDSEIHKVVQKAGLAWMELRGLNTTSTGALNKTLSISTGVPVVDKDDIYDPNNDFGISYNTLAPEVYHKGGVTDKDLSIIEEESSRSNWYSSADSAESSSRAGFSKHALHLTPAAKVNNFVASPKHSPIKASPVKSSPQHKDNVSVYASPGHAKTPIAVPIAVVDSSLDGEVGGSAAVHVEGEAALASLAAAAIFAHMGGDIGASEKSAAEVVADKMTPHDTRKHRVSVDTAMLDTAEAQDSPIRAPRHTPHVPPPPQNSLRDVNYRESFVGTASSAAATSALPTTLESPSPAAATKVAVKDTSEKESSAPRVALTTITTTPVKNGAASSNSNTSTPGPTGSAAVAVASGIYRAGSFRMTAPAPLRKESSGISNGGGSKNNTIASSATTAAAVVTSAAASGESIGDAEGATSAASAGSAGDRPAPMVSRKSINAGASSFKSPYTSGANTTANNATPSKSRKSVIEKSANSAVATNAGAAGNDGGDVGEEETRAAAEVTVSSAKSDSFATPKKGNMAASGTIVSQTASKIVSTPQNAAGAAGGAAESKSAIAPRRPNQAPTNNETARSALRNSRYGSLQKGTSSTAAGGASAEQKGDENNLDSEVSTPLVTKSGKASTQTEDAGSMTPSTPDKAASAAKTPSFKRASFVKKPSATK